MKLHIASLMGEHPGDNDRTKITVASLLNELATPLEAAINVLYLIRASYSDAELHGRLVVIAEQKLQEIVQIMKKYAA